MSTAFSNATSPHNPQICGPVAVIGVGLIGGSIAAAIRKRFPDVDVIGVGRTASRLEAARDAGLLTHVATSPAEISAAATVVACTPVNRLAEDLRRAAESVSDQAVLTDGGSVKGPLCAALADLRRFVGGHPLAGGASSGWEHADADLYDGKTCVVTPIDSCDADAVERVQVFWQAIGMNVVTMSPEAHDVAVAQTSHLPHIAAAAVTRSLDAVNESLVAAGFRDTTRVAAGDAAMWTAIVEANAVAVSSEIERVVADLNGFKTAIDSGDAEAVTEWFRVAAELRSRLKFE